MILADTSLWIDYFRSGDRVFAEHLAGANIVIHPFIVAELALGSLPQRLGTLTLLDNLPTVRVARGEEVRHLIETRSLYSQGIGLIDAHLIASTLITPFTQLWTRDRRLRSIAESLEIAAALPWAKT